jgi:elongator complex protein 5
LHPSASLLAVYHLDIPLPFPASPYAPTPLTTLTYLATSILTISSLSHVLTKKRFRDRSLPAPGFGLSENREGVVFGLKDGLVRGKEHGVVVEMEVRRKSGRGVRDVLVLCPSSSNSSILTPALAAAGKAKLPPPNTKIGAICLLDDWPGYAAPAELARFEGEEEDDGEEMESTFSLGLTEKQRRDREGVVLPYFDAQKGGTEGGRILYEMGREDDWDPEEDEI